jgi:hypothetical protein
MAEGREDIRIVSSVEWWRTDRISMVQFLSSAYTGDILLFRSNDGETAAFLYPGQV